MGKMKSATERFVRHGDVYIFDSTITANAVRKHGKLIANPVLAYGEATGHKHALMDETAYERYDLDGKTFLVVSEKGVSITHEEHGVGFIDAGVKEIRIDREYDYISEMSRNSVD